MTRRGWPLPAAAAALVLLTVASLTIGRYPLSLQQVVRALTYSLTRNDYPDTAAVVVDLIRLPRVLLALLCGAGLGLAGAAMQAVFRNPLVAPEIAGVQAGASLGGVVAILLAAPPAGVVALSFASGLTALVLTFGLARLGGKAGNLALVLAGVIVGTFFAALVGLAQYLADPQQQLPTITYWLLGSFVGATYGSVALVGTILLVGGSAILALRWRLNLLALDELDARTLGINVARLRWGLVTLVALIVAAQVAVSGGVGWIGLVVPHLARMVVGPDNRRVLPMAAVVGAGYLLGMDDLARTVAPQEIPIGLLTAAVGAPVFALLFWRIGNRGWARD